MDIMSHDSVSTLFGVSLLTDIWGDAVRSRIIINIWFWGKKFLDTFSMILIFYVFLFLMVCQWALFVCPMQIHSTSRLFSTTSWGKNWLGTKTKQTPIIFKGIGHWSSGQVVFLAKWPISQCRFFYQVVGSGSMPVFLSDWSETGHQISQINWKTET